MSADRPVPPDMNAVEITEPGGPDVLVARRVPTPTPGPTPTPYSVPVTSSPLLPGSIVRPASPASSR